MQGGQGSGSGAVRVQPHKHYSADLLAYVHDRLYRRLKYKSDTIVDIFI